MRHLCAEFSRIPHVQRHTTGTKISVNNTEMLSSIKSIPRLSLWCRCLSASCKKDCHVMPLTLTDICCVITQSFKVCNLIKIELFRRSIFILRKLYSETFHGGEVTIGYGYTLYSSSYDLRGTVNRPNFGQCRNFGQNRVNCMIFSAK